MFYTTMQKNKKNEELQSRREFFKKAAKGLLPMIGTITLGPIVFTSCSKDDHDENGCSDCTALCSNNCSSTCQGTSSLPDCSDCASSCESSCANSCSTACTGSSHSPLSSKGDGSFSNPFNATEARNFASSLSADKTTSKNFYVKGEVSSIKYNYTLEYGTAVFFMADEGGTEDVFLVYAVYYLENKPYKSGMLLAKGDKVVVCGKLCNYNGTTPEMAEKTGYLYSLNGKTEIETGNETPDISEASGRIDGYEYVDLGLSVKWARYNIGANKPEVYGNYVLFGNPTNSNSLPVFRQLGLYGNEKTISGTTADHAVYLWGSKWKMPTKKQIQELIDNSNLEYISFNEVNGLKFTSIINGKSIFLPAAGERSRLSSSFEYRGVGSSGSYWSGDIKSIRVDCWPYYFSFWKTSSDIVKTEITTWGVGVDETDFKFVIRAVTNGTGETPSGCTGNSCSSNCANNLTSSSCSNCGSGCSNGCKTTCSGNCPNGCMTLCGGQCKYSCGGTCSYVSAGSKCSSCANTCSTYCYYSCTMACSSSCMSCCISSAK